MHRNMTRGRRSRRGGVLIATLVATIAIGALSVCLLELDSTRLRQQVASIDNKRAFNLSEAGLAEAYFSVKAGFSGNIGTQAEPAKFGDGLFWVVATELGDNVIGLESTGMSGSGRATLSLVVKRQSLNLASMGIMSSQDVSVGARALVDAYDSKGGRGIPLINILTAPPAPLRSNGNITIGAAGIVRGNAVPGPGGSVSFGLLSIVTGSTTPASSPVSMLPVQVPKFTPAADIVLASGASQVINTPEVQYASIVVGSGASLALRGPTRVVVDQLTVQGSGGLEIDTTGGKVELYVTDWLNLASSAKLGFPAQDTAGFKLIATATGSRDRDGDGVADPALRFQANGPFFGSLYAPNARLALQPACEIYGTVAAQRLVIADGAKVHFDAALLTSDTAATILVSPLSWRVVEIPVQVARDLSEDPFDVLAVDPATLEKPSESRVDSDVELSIKYLDLSLSFQTYVGPESGFDWSGVSTVLGIFRQPLL